MKKLILKFICIFLSLSLIMGILMFGPILTPFGDELNLLTDSYKYSGFGTGEVSYVLERVRECTDDHILILGDSVAAQLFNTVSFDNVYAACGNQTMTCAWQYFFEREFFETNPYCWDLYLFLTPESISRLPDSSLTYQYMVIPMVKYGFLDELEPSVYSELESMYGSVLMNQNAVNFIGDSGLNRKLFLNIHKAVCKEVPLESDTVNSITQTYLPLMAELASKSDVRMHFLSAPVMDTEENHKKITALKEQFEEIGFDELFPEYFDSVTYYPPEMFKDEMHFKDELLSSDFASEVIKKVLETCHQTDF